MSLLDDDTLIMGAALENQPLTDEIAEALGFEKMDYRGYLSTLAKYTLVLRVEKKFLWMKGIEEIELNHTAAYSLFHEYHQSGKFEGDRYIVKYVKNDEVLVTTLIKTVKDLDKFCTEFLRKHIL